MVTGPRLVRSSASATLDAEQWRVDSAHNSAGSVQHRPHVRGCVGRRCYRTDDGGTTWQARNNGVRVMFLPEKYPEFGQCVHKIVLHESRPERLFLQNHWGLYRSDNLGDSWQDIARGVPSDFGSRC